ncbi:Wzz/FepE/Etk N-terminal domain-containing protein [Candidatus Pelagibacter ubique]|nr:Wzz/FepE/Etk N-terminal domain-containing protein [Candidatus Pelagibacter ubique]
MVKKKLATDEIDLIEIFQTIWVKKHSIIISIIFGLLIAFLIQLFEKPSKITAKTKIIPISVYEESMYEIYNSIIKKAEPMSLFFSINYQQTYDEIIKRDFRDNRGNPTPEKENYQNAIDSEIYNITKAILFEMFIETFEERAVLKNMLKKFNFIKKEDYPNNEAYEIAIDKRMSEIKLVNTVSSDSIKEVRFGSIIVFESNNTNEWENFLSFAEKEINQRVRIKLSEMFEVYLSYIKMLNKFNLEDFEDRLKIEKDDNQKLLLSKAIDELKKDKHSKRLIDLFDSSPIANKDDFYAAKISVDLTSYELTTDKISSKTLYISMALLSGILGIFFVLIAHNVQNVGRK